MPQRLFCSHHIGEPEKGEEVLIVIYLPTYRSYATGVSRMTDMCIIWTKFGNKNFEWSSRSWSQVGGQDIAFRLTTGEFCPVVRARDSTYYTLWQLPHHADSSARLDWGSTATLDRMNSRTGCCEKEWTNEGQIDGTDTSVVRIDHSSFHLQSWMDFLFILVVAFGVELFVTFVHACEKVVGFYIAIVLGKLQWLQMEWISPNSFYLFNKH